MDTVSGETEEDAASILNNFLRSQANKLRRDDQYRKVDRGRTEDAGTSRIALSHVESQLMISVFDIPPGLLSAFHRDSSKYNAGEGTNSGTQRPVEQKSAKTIVEGHQGLTCLRCKQTFRDRAGQLTHFKSDFHLLNLRRQLEGEVPLSLEEYSAHLSSNSVDDDDHHDVCEADSSDDTDENNDTVARGQVLDSQETTPDEYHGNPLDQSMAYQVMAVPQDEAGYASEDVRVEFSLKDGPKIEFVPLSSAWSFSLSSAALGMHRGDNPWERLRLLTGCNADETSSSHGLWAVVVLRSGRFAAAIFERSSVLYHKVFRRYTIRAKRGGSQSSHDSSGRKARSAGAALRRYGEQALREDVQALLQEWSNYLRACRVILVSVPKSMRTIIFDGKDAPFDRKDERLRNIPFAVGKPTFEEVVSIHRRVTSVRFAEVIRDEAEYTRKAGAHQSGEVDTNKVKQKSLEVVSRPVREEGGNTAKQQPLLHDIEDCPASEQLIAACREGDVVAVASLLNHLSLNAADRGQGGQESREAGGEAVAACESDTTIATEDRDESRAYHWTAADVINWPDGLERLMTPLHVASASGHADVLSALLEQGANPEAEDIRGRVPYLLASKKDVRDAFRRARAAQPDRWDWDAARVPEPLTEELEQRQKERQKERERDKRRRAKSRKKEERGRVEAAERERKASEEAAAAERRARGLATLGHCDNCERELAKSKAFHRFDFSYCSTDCANTHKRRLAADAAERRFTNLTG